MDESLVAVSTAYCSGVAVVGEQTRNTHSVAGRRWNVRVYTRGGG